MAREGCGGRRIGFTLVEILVAMGILLVVFTLVTVLHVRAMAIRRDIMARSAIQESLMRGIQLIKDGDRSRPLSSLTMATRLYSNPTAPLYPNLDLPECAIIFGHAQSSSVQYYLIAPGADSVAPDSAAAAETVTLWHAEGGYPPGALTWKNVGKETVYLEAGSRFDRFYYRSSGGGLWQDASGTTAETMPTLVKMTFLGKSRDPNLKNKKPVIMESAVRLRNQMTF